MGPGLFATTLRGVSIQISRATSGAIRADIVANVAGKTIRKRYDLTKPQGVRGRNSDNTRLREVLQWEPAISLEDGLDQTYHWIAGQLAVPQKLKTHEAGG